MKVVVAGIRYKDPVNKIVYDDYTFVVNAIAESGYEISELISGHAIGVDTLGEQYAILHDIPLTFRPADWNRHGKAAGPFRNKQMSIECDAAVIVWDGKSAGTYNMIQNMIVQKKPYFLKVIKGDITEFCE